ncbi:hypothetical protein THAOC_36268 [Thalassiosira oceanica]|uniref:Uncharacterized protein n=1 Tax=Thalassiosira oceanica TaxID=159749 RepID=K0RF14_THAOC|nr:hypothetical protein THAOC_36268 [Thalassiosira oceanica]|eukprot:EJK45132.1 hypothetical protein THAOC_36268 [Thalassiosira oceanica]
MRRPSCLADKRGTLSRAAGLAGMRHMLSADEQLSQAVCRGKPGDFSVASMRQSGINGFEQDDKKIFKDLVESADLGNRDACYALWNCYIEGSGVERDMNLAKYWCQVAALRGCSASRVELANFDLKARDPESAVRHLMISCRQGNDDGLNFLGRLYRVGLKRKDPCVTKDQYAEALRSHKKCADSMKSDSRAAAVAFARSLKSMFSSDFGFFFDDPNAVESRDDD